MSIASRVSLPVVLRVSFNGRTSASQAENEGSIPFTRSNLMLLLVRARSSGAVTLAGRTAVNGFDMALHLRAVGRVP